MTRASLLATLKSQIRDLMGTLSVEEILINQELIKKIETVLGLLPKAS